MSALQLGDRLSYSWATGDVVDAHGATLLTIPRPLGVSGVRARLDAEPFNAQIDAVHLADCSVSVLTVVGVQRWQRCPSRNHDPLGDHDRTWDRPHRCPECHGTGRVPA